LKKRKDIGSLSQHQGTINSLAFAGTTHLLSGAEDGRIGLFRTKDWECLHILRHKKPVTSLAVHPSRKVALSVGKEKSIKLWNLMTGKQAHSSILPHEPLHIQFSESGKHYAVLSDFNLVVFETETTKKILDFKSKTRLACMAVLRDELVFIAGEGSLIQIVEISAPTTPKLLETLQSPRIKGLSLVGGSFGDILVSASSSGLIKGWSLPDEQEIFSHSSNIRIICLTATIQE
jgi:protein MAK11